MLLHKLFIRHVKASIQEFSWINRKGYELFQQLKKASFKKKISDKIVETSNNQWRWFASKQYKTIEYEEQV